MKTQLKHLNSLVGSLSAAVLLAVCGCGKTGTGKDLPAPKTTKQAASQLEQVFATTTAGVSPEVKNNAVVASQALRSGEYETAIVSLSAIKQSQNLTLEQGMVVHNSMVALKGRILAAMEAGDPNAKRAFELLKRMKRD
jgi:hypothetical protein